MFFTFSSYEAKMRLVHNAMKARYGMDEKTMGEWNELRKSLNDFSELRNEIAHLAPMAKGLKEKEAKAIVRLVPPFWKAYPQSDFDKGGYSWDELTKALSPFWSFDPSLNIWDTSHVMLGFRLQQFNLRLLPPIPALQDNSSSP